MRKRMFEPTFEGGAAEQPKTVIGRARANAPAADSFEEAVQRLSPSQLEASSDGTPAAKVGEQIRFARLLRGMTQAELAERAKLRQADLSDLELGKNKHGPRYDTLAKLADALDLKLAFTPKFQPIHDIAPDALEVEILRGDPLKVSHSSSAYRTYEPMLSGLQWTRLFDCIQGQLGEARDGLWGEYCTLLRVEPGAKASFRPTRPAVLIVLSALSRQIQVHVKKPTHRFNPLKEPASAVAILSEDSKVEVDTSVGEAVTFMVVPSSAFIGEKA